MFSFLFIVLHVCSLFSLFPCFFPCLVFHVSFLFVFPHRSFLWSLSFYLRLSHVLFCFLLLLILFPQDAPANATVDAPRMPRRMLQCSPPADSLQELQGSANGANLLDDTTEKLTRKAKGDRAGESKRPGAHDQSAMSGCVERHEASSWP